jgi:hypothetical protein
MAARFIAPELGLNKVNPRNIPEHRKEASDGLVSAQVGSESYSGTFGVLVC